MMAWTTTATGAGDVGSAGEEATGRACRLVDPEVQRGGPRPAGCVAFRMERSSLLTPRCGF
jgi:hypothetical protein